MRPLRIVLPLVLVAVGLSGCGRPRQSESPPAGSGAEEIISDDTPSEEAQAEEDAIAAHNERVLEKASKSLPDNAQELIELIEKDNQFRLADNDQDSIAAKREMRQAIPRVIAAGKKLHEIATDEERKTEGYQNAMGVWMLFRAVYTGSGEFDDLVIDMKEIFAAGPPPSEEAAQTAVLIVDNFKDSDPARAVQLCHEFMPILDKSDKPNVRSCATRLEGIERGLDLVGHTLEIKGTTVDGKPFDIAELRGKVVLVDFFTTWSGPFREELPDLRRVYDRRHKDGFEVVTINLDDEREALDRFLQEEPVPWTVLYDGPWAENKNAIYYGVSGVPDLVLIDKEGKVVSHDWKGEEWRKKEWRKKLKELLGPGDPADESDSDPDETDTGSDSPTPEPDAKASDASTATPETTSNSTESESK